MNGNGDQKGGGSTVVGTFGYCAPETYMGNATPLSDLYGAGATLLFLLAGVSPSTMPSSRLRVDFRGVVRIESGRLEATVARLLEPSPEDRFGGAGEALAALRGKAPDSVTSTSNSNGGRMGGRMFDRRREGAEDDAEDERDFWNEDVYGGDENDDLAAFEQQMSQLCASEISSIKRVSVANAEE